jgi:endonuclease-3
MRSKKPRIDSRIADVILLLKRKYPDARCTLDFETPHQLLVATVLSAQCTDERVNIVTKDLFKRYRRPKDFAEADIRELERDIRSAGFFRNKAKSIKESARLITNHHGGRIPRSMSELVRLPGVGRKTASVILGTAFGKAEGIAVDTHVMRLSRRLGLSGQKDAARIEKDLMRIVPRDDWIIFSHLLISHGRAVCHARKPECKSCILRELCPAATRFL